MQVTDADWGWSIGLMYFKKINPDLHLRNSRQAHHRRGEMHFLKRGQKSSFKKRSFVLAVSRDIRNHLLPSRMVFGG